MVVAKTLTAFHCIACHQRNDYGGVPDDYKRLLSIKRKESRRRRADSAPLTMVGAKLQSLVKKGAV